MWRIALSRPGLSASKATRPSQFRPDLKVCINRSTSSLEIGKYLVSPLSKRTPDARYTASVSIRSGQGRATHDRVLRLLPLFNSSDDALSYALREGMAWVHERTPATSSCMSHTSS